MHLWTEYEGRTIAKHYTLGKLLRSEGRNGFFATADKDGHPAVIRLTEAHFDEAEQLERWRHVAAVHQDNLIEIEQVGQTTFEGVALTYALMEPDDANLGDVLKERPLTTAETMQVAKAVLAAVKALHERNLVHEHIEPANVLAVGETVKLRSDCVRDCVPDGEFNTPESCAELRRADLRSYGHLLLRCLTLETEWLPAHNNLPDPFQRVIPKALEGSWTPEQIGRALDPGMFAAAAPPAASPRPAAVPPVSEAAAVVPAATAATSGEAAPNPELGIPVPAAAAGAVPATPTRPLVPPGVLAKAKAAESRTAAHGTPDPTEPAMRVRQRPLDEDVEVPARTSPLAWVLAGLAVLVVLLLGWHFLAGGAKTAPAARTGGAARSAVGMPALSPEAPGPAAAPQVVSRPAEETSPAATHGAPGWYVIAFTYNREGQAAAKAQHLRRTHDSLHPQVFTPTGRAPFFVSLGGAMTEGQANEVLRHARRAGLPRDTFVRHY